MRVVDGSVTTDGTGPTGALTVGEVGRGLCVFVGVTHDDDEPGARKLADKVWNLRVFDDDDGVMNRALSDGCGDALVVSQFTLYGDASKGRRPSWIAAARPDVAEPLVDVFVEALRELGARVETGRWVVQAAPTGFSAFVSPSGEVHQRTGVSERAVVTREIELRRGRTWYVTLGDRPWIVAVIIVFGVAAWFGGGRARFRSRSAASPDHR